MAKTQQEVWLNPSTPPEIEELSRQLQARVVGQDEAVSQVVRALARYRAGLAGTDRPVASFLMLGPTGVGKTLTAEALAEMLHGTRKAVLKIHCSELRSDHELARMKGSPPGYVGWKECVPLFHDVKLKEVRLRDDLALVLFDEIEKAHPALWDLLLGLLDKGEVVLNDNTRSDFRRTIVFLTGNVGAREVADAMTGSMGFQPHTRGDLAGLVTRSADRLFSPEFRNRLTATITYNALNWDAVLRICHLELEALRKALRARERGPDFTLQFEEDAVEQIARQGSGAAAQRAARGGANVYGARDIVRVIERLVSDPLANLLAAGRVQDDDLVIVCAGRNEHEPLRFRRKKHYA